MNYYISDMHLGHKNALIFDERPFETVEEMNEALIRKWNEKVNEDDDVWILGDFCYRSEKDPSFYLKQLKGHKHLVIGNHDKITLKSGSALQYFESVERLQHIKDGEYDVILCHFPLADWNAKRWGSYHVYGHIHNNEDEVSLFMSQQERALNAGCMVNGYEPVTLEELIKNNEVNKSIK